MDQTLMLQEEVLLLALKDEKGTIDWRAEHIDYLLAGAVFAELLLIDRIAFSKDKKQTVRVVNPQPLGDIKSNKDRIEKITRGELVGQATAKVIEAVETTVVMMAVMPIFLSTTIISS